jgi:hypothetical protein
VSRGAPWWLYICSQLGFTKSFFLLLQVSVLGLAGFMYSSSGLLPRLIEGMLKVRTRGVIPSSSGMLEKANAAEIDCFGCDDENDQSVGNPKRKV